jgi:tetratricopeptide (TPR) repeat protein
MSRVIQLLLAGALSANLLCAALDAIASRITAGDYRGAVAALDAISAADRDAEWHLLGSKAFDGLNDPARAVAEAQIAIEMAPRNETARLQLAGIFLSRNTPDAAYEILSDALPLFPDSPMIHLGRGLALNGMRRYEDAIRDLNECLRLKPDFGSAFDALGAAYLNKGDYEGLLREAAEYSRRNPSDFRGPYYEAAAREELGMDALQTEPLARRSLELNPRFAAAHALLGRVLLDLNDPAQAVSELRDAIRLRPGYAPAHLYLSRALRKLGKAEEAQKEAAEVSKLNEEESRPVPHLLYHRGNRPPTSENGVQK